MANQILEKVNDLKVMLGLWALLFVLTIIFSDLDMRSLFTAFCAWAGGIVSVRLDSKLRENRKRGTDDRH